MYLTYPDELLTVSHWELAREGKPVRQSHQHSLGTLQDKGAPRETGTRTQDLQCAEEGLHTSRCEFFVSFL